MISKLSAFLTKKLIERDKITSEEKELYEYGLFMILSYLVFFIIAEIIGIIIKIPLEAILFFVTFSLIRNFSGGVHADSEIKCDIITTISISVSELLIRLLKDTASDYIVLVMLSISSILLIVLRPVGSQNKEISEEDITYYHKKVILLTVPAAVASVLCIIFDRRSISAALSVALSLVSVLFVTGKIQRSRVKES